MKSRVKVTIKVVGLTALLILGPVGVARAQPGVELDEAVVAQSEVLGIDAGRRILTVVGPREEILELQVSDNESRPHKALKQLTPLEYSKQLMQKNQKFAG